MSAINAVFSEVHTGRSHRRNIFANGQTCPHPSSCDRRARRTGRNIFADCQTGHPRLSNRSPCSHTESMRATEVAARHTRRSDVPTENAKRRSCRAERSAAGYPNQSRTAGHSVETGVFRFSDGPFMTGRTSRQGMRGDVLAERPGSRLLNRGKSACRQARSV